MEIIQVAINLRWFPACGWALHCKPKPSSVGRDSRVFPVEVAVVAWQSAHARMQTLVRIAKRGTYKAK
jgi:hypothetical protein